MPTILMTGAAGRIGTMLRPRLARPGRTLRLLDIAPLTAAGEEAVGLGDRPDRDDGRLRGGRRRDPPGPARGEEDWASILGIDINGGRTAFEAARRAGVSRVIVASSNHAVGFAPRASFPVPNYTFPEPDSYYASPRWPPRRAASLYHHRYGLDAICVRILTSSEPPENPRALSTWLSPDDDAASCRRACPRQARLPRDLRGVGQYPGRLGSLNEACALGYEPRRRRSLRRGARRRPGRPR